MLNKFRDKQQIHWPRFSNLSPGFWYIKFCQKLVRAGKLIFLENIFRTVCFRLKDFSCSPIFYFYNAMWKLRPIVNIKWKLKQKKKSSRVEAYYQIPYAIRFEHSVGLALKWFIVSLKKEFDRRGVNKVALSTRIFTEILKYATKQETYGLILKKAVYTSAVQNRAAARFRW